MTSAKATTDLAGSPLSLRDARVVVTGGSSGIGLETARMAIAGGAKEVVILARGRDRLETAAELLGERASTFILDVTKEEDVARVFAEIGKVDHLVTAAAGTVRGELTEIDTSAARGLFEAKFWGQHHCVKYGARNIVERGSVTLFSGWISRKPMRGLGTLAAIDGAIEALTLTLSLELAPVRVNAIVPGQVDSPLWRTRLSEEDAAAYFDGVDQVLPVGRRGRPSDIAHAVHFLMTNGFTSGAILDVDGGQGWGTHK